jgi:hypothetical protein
MDTDARRQRELIAALDVESLLESSGLAFSKSEWETIRPTDMESAHAAANIREWRSYLPAACVNSMIDDGWQWST